MHFLNCFILFFLSWLKMYIISFLWCVLSGHLNMLYVFKYTRIYDKAIHIASNCVDFYKLQNVSEPNFFSYQ